MPVRSCVVKFYANCRFLTVGFIRQSFSVWCLFNDSCLCFTDACKLEENIGGTR